MTGLKLITAKFVAFAVVSLALLLVLLNTMFNGLPDDSRDFDSVFSDVNGLRVGDDVRVAGVRVGRVEEIGVDPAGARVGFALEDDQPLLANTTLVMRYQNLLGQRYLSLEQPEKRGPELKAGSTVPLSRTSPGFDLTELLNGFRPLFETLRPADVNRLATTLVKTLQGEGGTVEQLLKQTSHLTNFLADKDKVFDKVLVNLTPVLENLAGQGTELTSTVKELKALMTGLARDRKSIGASIDGVSQLIGSTSDLLSEARVPAKAAVSRLREVAHMFADNRVKLVKALKSFGTTFESFARGTSYQNALNIYLCTSYIEILGQSVNLAGGKGGPYSEVCR